MRQMISRSTVLQLNYPSNWRLHSSVGIATTLSDDRRIWVRVLGEARDFSLLHNVDTASGAHRTSNPTGAEDCFSGDKADHLPPSSLALER
jgi:hypothetical protein